MEALYKMRKPKTGQGDRKMRVKLKDTASKSSRANLLDTKRRIPLSEVQPSNKMPEEKEKETALTRAEKLVVWKKQREEAKAKQREAEKKNPPFRPGGKRPTVIKPVTVCLSNALAPKTAPSKVKKNETSASTSVSTIAPQAKKLAKKTNAGVGPSRSSARLAAKQTASASVAQKSSVTGKKNTNVVRPSEKPRTRAQQMSNSKKAARVPKPSASGGKSVTANLKGATTKSGALTRQKAMQENVDEKRMSTRSVTSKTSSNKRSTAVKAGSVSKSKTTSSGETEVKVDDSPDGDMPVDPPTTPKKNHYVPIHPSPLLKSQVAPARRETVYVPPFINDPAWIPGSLKPMNFTSSIPDFDETFKPSFSPFRFTAISEQLETVGNTSPPQPQQQFVFQPQKLNYETYPLSERESTVSSPPARKRRRSSRRCSRMLESVAPLIVDSLKEGESVSVDTCSAESQKEKETATGISDGVDIAYFRGLHSGVTEKFTQLCQEWEAKSNKLEQEYTNDNGMDSINVEDVLGQIRTTVGQAQLLMKKKLKQYLSLVEETQDPAVEKKANADDLQSFWDMVYFQVEDVQAKFDAIDTLERNGWKQKDPTPAKKRTKKVTKAGAKKPTSCDSSAEANARLQVARDRREAQRNRLRELKLAAKRAREQEAELTTEKEVATNGESQEESLRDVTPSPKKSRLARSPKVDSTGRIRRRSERLLSRSVFSPMEVVKPTALCASEVPTGSLISLY